MDKEKENFIGINLRRRMTQIEPTIISLQDTVMKKIDEYMLIKEAASFLGVTPSTLRNWEKDKKIRVYRNPQNRYRLYKKEDLETLLYQIQKSRCKKLF